ncbi:LPXTG_cell wall anchor domain-containing protein [Hexamita inflata]|uniref:LPXTG_cell wall anchor domain-containing protein n=1 Tax=Hexamita inflata TaxID=28002 RepID=A0ABP1LJR4_9EUKA
MNKIKVRKFISHSLNCCLCQLCLAEIHLRCTITVSKEAMERLPLSNPEGSLMTCHQSYRSLIAAQHQWTKPVFRHCHFALTSNTFQIQIQDKNSIVVVLNMKLEIICKNFTPMQLDQKQDLINYDLQMIELYEDNTYENGLQLFNDQNVTSIKFIEQLDINLLKIEDCDNISYENFPQNIIKLIIIDNKLDISMIYNQTQIIQLEIINSQVEIDLSQLIDLNNLQKLNLEYSLTQNLQNVTKFHNLKDLNFRELNLHNIDFLKTIDTQLTQLTLGNNNLTNISILKSFCNLQELKLQNNLITDIFVFQNLEQLSHLDLSFNLIENIDVLQKMIRLKFLYLSHNCIINVKALQNLTNITQLDLNSNYIINFSDLKSINQYKIYDQKLPNQQQILISSSIDVIHQQNKIQQKIRQDQMEIKKKLQKEVDEITKLTSKQGHTYSNLLKNIINLYKLIGEYTQ